MMRFGRPVGGALPRLQILATAVLFSTGGAAIKATQLDSWQVACFRSGIAALVLLVALPSARRGWKPRIVPVGFAYACALTAYVGANKLTTAANTIFLYSAVPLYVLILGPWLLKEPFRRRDGIVVAAFLVGMTLCFLGTETPVDTAPMPFEGNVLATVGGFCFALTVMGLRWIGRDSRGEENSSVPAVVSGNIIAFLVCLPMAVPVGTFHAPDWGWVFYLGSVQVGLAYVLLTRAVRTVPAMEVSLLLLVEPALNPIWAWAMHDERPATWTMGGGAVILVAILAMIADDVLRARARLDGPAQGAQ